MSSEGSWIRRLERAEGPLLLAFTAAFTSSRVGPSWDEAYWLAVGRMVEGGRSLYEDAIDNKGPFIHLLVWMLDRLPGPYSLARGLFVGMAIGVALHLGLVLAPLSKRGGRIVLAAVVGVWVLLMTDLVVTTELCAMLSLIGALAAARSDHPWTALALSIIAAGFDTRALLLLPAVAIAVSPSYRRRVMVGMTIAVGVAAVIVLAVPRLSYALIELSLASRGEGVTYPAASMVRSLFEALVPLLALSLVFRIRRFDGCGGLGVAGSIGVGRALRSAIQSLLDLPGHCSLRARGRPSFHVAGYEDRRDPGVSPASHPRLRHDAYLARLAGLG